MKLAELTTHTQALAERLEDPAFRERWERTALARTVALRVVTYRAQHELSQAQLAKHLGLKPAVVARLELGEQNPSLEMLYLLSQRLGIEFVIDIAPAGSDRLLQRSLEHAEVVEAFTSETGSHVLIAIT
ncbi:MAG: helix-turn-helix transcriptional regulator [Chloroflexi bacterium]|nr:helix-turn-helix transcriptional regulator [Chloroflexota bacterium]